MKLERTNILKGYNLLLYFTGSMLMNEPTDECITDFWISGNIKKLPVSSSNPRFLKAASILRDSCKDKDTCRKMLSDDYKRMFEEEGSQFAPAYASAYLTVIKNSNRIRIEISKFYKTYGWVSPHPEKSEDHLGIELLFLTKLIDRYVSLDDNPCRREMSKEICRFIDNYILSWVPEWVGDIEEYANTICFKGIGILIHACIEDIKGLMSDSEEQLS